MNKIAFRFIGPGTPAYNDMAALRIRVLLDPVGIPHSYINPQHEASDVLIGAFESNRLIGCCILTEVAKDIIQLRQMAVDSSFQGKGIGAAILSFAENIAQEKGYRVLMMHARDTVILFYEKCGYQIYGEPFSEVGIGHHKMQKQLVTIEH